MFYKRLHRSLVLHYLFISSCVFYYEENIIITSFNSTMIFLLSALSIQNTHLVHIYSSLSVFEINYNYKSNNFYLTFFVVGKLTTKVMIGIIARMYRCVFYLPIPVIVLEQLKWRIRFRLRCKFVHIYTKKEHMVCIFKWFSYIEWKKIQFSN